MECLFDFYVTKAYSDSIRALLKVPGVKRDNINSKMDYSGRWPKPQYEVSLKFHGVMEFGIHQASAKADEFRQSLPLVDRVRYHTSYVCID